MNIYHKLKERRKELGLTMLEVANMIGVSEATVSRWESGDIANMRRDKIVSLAKALQVHPSFIMGLEDNAERSPLENNSLVFKNQVAFPPPYDNLNDNVTFPVIGEVAAGYDFPAIEDWDGEKIDIPVSYLIGRNKNEFFVLKVKGDSMYPDFQDGDKVLVLKQSTLNYSGQVGVVLYDGELATLKKVEYKMGENWMRFVAINPSYPPKLIENEDLELCRVLGIPKLLIRDMKY